MDYTGLYSAISGGASVTGPQSFIAIPTFNSRIANGTSSFTFNVDVNGNVTSLNADAATSNGNTLVFNNTLVEVDPTTYAGLYTVTGFPGWFSNVSTMTLVPDLTVRLTADGESDVFTADATQVTPPSFDLTILGQPHSFLFSVQNGQEVVIPNVTASYNDLLSIPVTISGTAGTDIVAAEVFVCYDGGLLTPTGVDISGTLLTPNWSIETNIEDGGQIDTYKIAMATDADALTGPGTLINIVFQVADVRVPSSSDLVLKHVLFNDGDPGNTTVDGSLTVVGTDATISSLPAQVVPRETITITVVDADADLNGTPGNDQVSVAVTNGNNGDTVNLTLAEDAATAGTFSGSVDTEFGTAALIDALIQAQAGDAIVSTYSDALDANGNGPTDRTAQTDAVGGADGSVKITLATQPGDVVYIQASDADLNTDPGNAETVVVTATSSNGESEDVTLIEVDADDDVFFGSVNSTAGASAGTDDDGTFNAQKGDVLTATYVDVVTAVGSTANLTAVDQVIDPFGDADGNGTVQAFDAAQVLLHVLSPFLTGLEAIQANVDTDPVGTGINPFDASLILQKRVGLISTFPVQLAASTNHPQSAPASPKQVAENRWLILSYEDGYLSLRAEERAGLISGDLLVKGVNGKVAMAEELSDFLSASRKTDDGLRIVFAGASPVSGPGELLRIYPGMGPDEVQLTRAQFNGGRIAAQAQVLASGHAAPEAFVLHANRPNPFNPETTIRFELPRENTVRLEVFDVLGQRVKTLVAGPLAAGVHEAVWDGRSEEGIAVGNGVYFYRLKASSSSQMRRMLFLK